MFAFETMLFEKFPIFIALTWFRKILNHPESIPIYLKKTRKNIRHFFWNNKNAAPFMQARPSFKLKKKLSPFAQLL